MDDEVDSVDGEGWISDESDFYGDVDIREGMKARIGHNSRSSYSSLTPRVVDQSAASGKSLATLSNHSPAQSKTVNAMDFLKNRPQIAAHRASAIRSSRTSVAASSNHDATELVDNDRFEGDVSAWQHSETIAEFVKRAPVSDTTTAQLGPWLWIGPPKIKSVWRDRSWKANVHAMTTGGNELLSAYSEQQQRLERTLVNPTPATMTRKMGPYRDQLEDDLLTLAVKTSTTCGKWMLFPSDEEYPRYWRVVAEATAASKLGPVSKAATYNPVDPVNLICIYTYDFTDREDVLRVLEELIDLGLCARDGKPIHYKCDAYTYLGITSSNDYKLKASVYSSKAILGLEEKPKKDGPIDRLNKRTRPIDTFFAT